jgi:hypothetical protein
MNRITNKVNSGSGLVEPINEANEDESIVGGRDSASDSGDEFGRTDDVIDLSKVDATQSSQSKKSKAKSLLPADYESPKSMLKPKTNADEESELREALEFQMRIFDYRYDFSTDMLQESEC